MTDALQAIRRHCEALASGESTDPYETGWEIWGIALGRPRDGTNAEADCCHAMWLIWGSLTDWVENRPAERQEAENAMRRAATEWLAVADDPSAWPAYLDRWVYDEMGYERPSDSS